MITDAIKIQTIHVDGKFIRLLNISPDREMCLNALAAEC